MSTLKKPVKAGLVFVLVLSLVLSSTVPRNVVYAQQVVQNLEPLIPGDFQWEPGTQLRQAPENPQIPYFWIDDTPVFAPLPPYDPPVCIDNIQEATYGASIFSPALQATVKLEGKVKYCESEWSVQVNPSSSSNQFGLAFEAVKISNESVPVKLEFGKDGKVAVDASIQLLTNERTSLGEASFKIVGPNVAVTEVKYTHKIEDSERSLTSVTSLIIQKRVDDKSSKAETKRNSLNLNPNTLEETTKYIAKLGVAALAALAAGTVVIALGSDAGEVDVVEDNSFIKEFLKSLSPAQVSAYEGVESETDSGTLLATTIHYGGIDTVTGSLNAPDSVIPGQTFSYSGSGFTPNGDVLVSLVLLPHPETTTQIVQAGESGQLSGSITLPDASQMVSGKYLLTAVDISSAYYNAKDVIAGNSDSSTYTASKLINVSGGTATKNTNVPTAFIEDVLDCSRVSLHDMTLAYLFSGQSCGDDITWFSAHDANGPSASGQQSLYVPSGAVVNVSSNDNGGGDTACFAATVNNLSLVGWQDRIQWAQVVPGGTCQSDNTNNNDHITLDTSGGDVVLHVGEDWDNQHNWIIEKFWQDGDAHIEFTHQNGSTRCWDYDVTNLQTHGDWNVQTSSVSVGSGSCAGHDAVFCTDDSGNDGCKPFAVGEHNLLDTSENDKYHSLTSVASGKSVMVYRENGSMGTAECYNGPRTPLPSGGNWDLKGEGTILQVFSQQNCPASEINALVMYRDFDQGGPALGLGTEPGVINLTEVPGPVNGNDWGASLRIPSGMSAKAYIHTDKGGNNSGCKTGDINLAGEFYRQASSIELFDNSSCITKVSERLYLGASDRNLVEQSTSSISGGYTPLVGDFDGDGYEDILFYSTGNQEVVLWGGLNATFTNIPSNKQVGGTYTPLVGDFNGDGYHDVLWYAPGSANEVIHWGNPSRSFTGSPSNKQIGGTYTPLVGDFDGDGYHDILWYSPGSTNEVVHWGQASGDFTGATSNKQIGGTYTPLTGDFDGDGRHDVLWYAPGLANEVVHWGQASRNFTGSTSNKQVSGTYRPLSGDFDGDGFDDVFWYTSNSPSDVVHWGQASRDFTGSTTTSINGSYHPVSGDFDADGDDDIYWYGVDVVAAASILNVTTALPTENHHSYLPLIQR